MIPRIFFFLMDHWPKFFLGVAVVLFVVMMCSCTAGQYPTNVITDRSGKQHEVIHSEFGATVLP